MKYKTSSLLSELKGKIGSSVLSNTRSIKTVRSFKLPFDPFTANQIMFRQFYSFLCYSWNVLSASIRLAYNNAATTYTWYNTFGDAYHPTGLQVFLYIHLNRYPVLSTIITSPPVSGSVGFYAGHVNNLSLSGVSFVFDSYGWNNNHEFYKLFVTKIYDVSSTYLSKKFYYIGYISNYPTTSFNMYTLASAFFGASLTLNKYFKIKIFKVDNLAGLKSTDFINEIIITA